MLKIAIIQKCPALLDRAGTIQKAVQSVDEAAEQGARLIIFPEAFIPGYPSWMWRLRPGADYGLTEKIYTRLFNNAVNLQTDHLQPLYDAARKHQVTITCGIHERDGMLSGGTLYNTAIIIGSDGTLNNVHRKLMPTNPERMVWGNGDASGLKVVDTEIGKIGTLICWENYMPLARYALYAQGIEIYIAPTYDSGDAWLGTMQHIAREGCCYVISAGCVLDASDIPDDFPEKATLYPDNTANVNPGDSMVVEPGGKLLAGPMHIEQGILFAEIDIAKVGIAKRCMDIVGHYARPDIFTLQVNRQKQSPIAFVEN